MMSCVVYTMTVDVLAPCITRSSATMILIMEDEEFLAFHKEKFQVPVHLSGEDKSNVKCRNTIGYLDKYMCRRLRLWNSQDREVV